MLVGAITFGKGFISWPANLPITYYWNACFGPKHSAGSAGGLPKVVPSLQPNRKTISEIQTISLRHAWFSQDAHQLTTGNSLPHGVLGTLQTNKDQFELINNNILYFKFCFCGFLEDF